MKEMNKKAKGGYRIGEIVASCVLILAVLLCVTIMTQVLSVGYVQIAGLSVFRVATGSMEPEIPVDAVLLCRKTEIESIQVNDVVCFRSREQAMLGSVITHRVIQVLNAPDGTIALETKGDANLVADGDYVTQKNLVGKVVWFTGERSAMTSILAFLNNKVGFLACIVFPCLLVAGVILRNCIGNIKGELHTMLRQLDSEETPPPELTPEEYQQIYEQVKAELLKELGLSGEENAQ